MKTYNKGFTLIELVVVIVILGILGAVAVPRFVDLSSQAETAAITGVAGALSSGMAINYAACKAGAAAPDCVTIDDCDDGASVLQDASAIGVGTGQFTITAAVVADDVSVSCTLTDNDTAGVTATFTAIGT